MVPVSATIVFIQPSSLTVGSQTSDEDGSQFIGDNFSLVSPETIRSVTWYGLYHSADTPLTDAFTIAFYDDNGSAAPQVSPFQSESVSAIRTATGNIHSGFDEYLYKANITDLPLSGSTPYYLSIDNDTTLDADDNWAWEASASGLGYFRGLGGGSWSTFGADMVFSLDTTPVPEPAQFGAMLGAFLALIILVRRRDQ